MFAVVWLTQSKSFTLLAFLIVVQDADKSHLPMTFLVLSLLIRLHHIPMVKTIVFVIIIILIIIIIIILFSLQTKFIAET